LSFHIFKHNFEETLRVFAISDIHIDFKENRLWVHNLSQNDYKDDILILAGDVTDISPLLAEAFQELKSRFSEVLYVNGNHDLWVRRRNGKSSLEKFHLLKTIARDCGVCMEPAHFGSLSVVPLFGWYDYSFGQPSDDILRKWADYSYCKWPEDFDETRITHHFISMNETFLATRNQFVISFSHFFAADRPYAALHSPQKKKTVSGTRNITAGKADSQTGFPSPYLWA